MTRPAMPFALVPSRLAATGERGWSRFEASCDRTEIMKLAEKELDLDEVLGFYETWSAGWWQTLREIDKVRSALIRTAQRIHGGGAA